jgi:hypothetical protein
MTITKATIYGENIEVTNEDINNTLIVLLGIKNIDLWYQEDEYKRRIQEVLDPSGNQYLEYQNNYRYDTYDTKNHIKTENSFSFDARVDVIWGNKRYQTNTYKKITYLLMDY